MTSRTIIKNRIYEMTKNLTSHRYYDEYWAGPSRIFDVIRDYLDCIKEPNENLELNVYVENGGYMRSKDGESEWKGYNVEIWRNESPIICGYLNCHQCGTVEDPWSAYDMSLILSL